MVERNWAKDWELCQRATPGPWRWVYYKWTDIYVLVGPRDETILDDGSYRGEYDSPGERLITPDDPNGQFIAAAREALPYWLQQVKELDRELSEAQLNVQVNEKLWLETQEKAEKLEKQVKELEAELIRLTVEHDLYNQGLPVKVIEVTDEAQNIQELEGENACLRNKNKELEEENRRLRATLISVGASIAIARNGLAEPPMLEHVDKHTKQALDEVNAALEGGGKGGKQ